MGSSEPARVATSDVVLYPVYAEWPELFRATADLLGSWDATVGGVDVRTARDVCRRELLAMARAYTEGLPSAGSRALPPATGVERIVSVGHQPGFVHPGVWSKYVVAERMAEDARGVAVEIVVDTDTLASVGAPFPYRGTRVSRKEIELVHVAQRTPWVCVPSPTREQIVEFGERGSQMLAGFPPAVGVRASFARFCASLEGIHGRVADLASFMTAVRRVHEGPARSYLSLPVSQLARSKSYLTFVAAVIGDADRFAAVYNEALARHRSERGLRSPAEPFPNLEIESCRVELPFWVIDDRRRERAVLGIKSGRGVTLTGGSVRLDLPDEPPLLLDALMESRALIAPRALTLMLFVRMLFADVFVHGTGGARYDRVTDRVAEELWGLQLPAYAVCSLTLCPALGVAEVDRAELTQAEEALRRLAYHPEEVVLSGSLRDEDREQAVQALTEKSELVRLIKQPGADKKAIGERIRVLNGRLAASLSAELRSRTARRDALAAALADHEVATRRTYPYFFWDADVMESTVLEAFGIPGFAQRRATS